MYTKAKKMCKKLFVLVRKARPAASCAQAELTACTRVIFLAKVSGGNTQVTRFT